MESRQRAEQRTINMLHGRVAQIKLDTETGLVVALRIVEAIQGTKSSYQSDINTF